MTNADQYTFYVTKCELRGGVLVERGNYFPLTIREVVAKFAPSKQSNAKANILKAKSGSYLGICNKNGQVRNFVIYNPSDNGDIRWLLEKVPELESSIIEVYLVNDIDRPKSTQDILEDK